MNALRHRITLGAILFVVAVSAWASAVAAAEAGHAEIHSTEPNADFALLGHESMVDGIQEGADIWTLGREGLLIAWRDGSPRAWAVVGEAWGITFDGPAIGVLFGDRLDSYSRDLVPLGSEPMVGAATCPNEAAVWTWQDGGGLQFVSAAGRVTLEGEAPLDAARCSTRGDDVAIAWDQGGSATLRSLRGETREIAWPTAIKPVPTWGPQGWDLQDPEGSPTQLAEPPAERTASSRLRGASQLGHYLAPVLREPLGVTLFPGGIVVADRGGWSLLYEERGELLHARINDPVVALIEGPSPLVVTCSHTATGSFQVLVRDALTGEPQDRTELPGCPLAARRIAERIVLETGSGEIVLDKNLPAVQARSSAFSPPMPQIRRSWSAICAGDQSEVFLSGTSLRVFGPICGEAQTFPIFDSTGHRIGFKVCSAGEFFHGAFQNDGRPFPGEDRRCQGSEVATAPHGGGAADEEREPTALVQGARIQIPLGEGHITLLLSTGGVVATVGAHAWAAGDVLDRLVWRRDGTLEWAREAGDRMRRDEQALARALRRLR